MFGKFLFAFFIIFGSTQQTAIKAEADLQDNAEELILAPRKVCYEGLLPSCGSCKQNGIQTDTAGTENTQISDEDDADLLSAMAAAPCEMDMSWTNQARTLLAIAKAQAQEKWQTHRKEIIIGVVATVVVCYLAYRYYAQ